ncbi:hypothetical protein LCGC14_2584010 [marine sediment metagenome]|uniref:ASCH domain-containing protein n=1 Tax=marine sediment metagenome TaxID=412755 RepID=A0A0F9B1I6_9ZZZZ
MNVSFAWTTPALLAGRKSVTRRDWTTRFASQFHVSDLVSAYDKLTRNHGRHVATVPVLRAPYQEALGEVPDSDYEAEGFLFFEEHPELLPTSAPWPKMNWDVFNRWRYSEPYKVLWVLRFAPVGSAAALRLSQGVSTTS